MSGIIHRPTLFGALGDDFSDTFGNVDVTPVVGGVGQSVVRGILRQVREMDLIDDRGVAVEGVTHSLALAAAAGEMLVSGRDSVVIDGVIYPVRTKLDDGRAMIKLYLKGDV